MNVWNHEKHDDELIRLHELGWTHQRIGETMGFARSTIQQRSARLNLSQRKPTPKPWTESKVEALAKALLDPSLTTWDAVADAIGEPVSRARDKQWRMRFPALRRTGSRDDLWKQPRTERLVDIYSSGVRPVSRIAKILGITKNSAIGKLWRLGLKERKQEVASVYHHPLMSVPANGCLWPNVDLETPATEFCGRPHAGPGLPYCQAHMKAAYQVAPDGVLKHSPADQPRKAA